MAWIDGTHEETFVVDAPFERVRDVFCDPAEFKAAFTLMETATEVEPGTWHWVLQEKVEKGIKFKADYTVKYERDGDVLTWDTVEGNMKSRGRTEVVDKGGKGEVRYTETISTELPIPRLASKVFQPIVQREVTKGVTDFLRTAQQICENES